MALAAYTHVIDLGQLEEWRPLPSNPAYRISSLGRVRGRRGWILKLQKKNGRHLSVGIDGKVRYVHHLVAETYIGPRPEGLFALHKNDVGDQNDAGNIYYGTRSDNLKDAYRNGHIALGRNHRGDFDLTPSQAGAIRALKGIVSEHRLANAFGRVRCPIQAIHAGRTWKYAPVVSCEEALEIFHAARLELERRREVNA